MWEPQGIFAKYMQNQPVIFQGEEALLGLNNFPGSRIAVISGSGFGTDQKELLKSAFKKRQLEFVKKSWNGEPEVEQLAGTVRELEKLRPDVIIAAGGGSVIDGVKLCRVLYEFPYIFDKDVRMGQMIFSTKYIAVPTTVGSGAEASSAAVYYDPIHKCKRMLVNQAFRPDAIVMNPSLIRNSPLCLVASSSADMMAHALEGYVSTTNNPLADMIAENCIHTIYEEFNKNDFISMDFQRLQYAGYWGGVVQNECLVGIAHAVAHQMTAGGISHSAAVSFLLPYTIQMHEAEPDSANRLDILSHHAGFESVSELLQLSERLYSLSEQDKDVAVSFLRENVDSEDFISNIMQDPGGKGNPVPLTEDYIKGFIGEILK